MTNLLTLPTWADTMARSSDKATDRDQVVRVRNFEFGAVLLWRLD
jgi:hypothetical protein